jgi:hypothetical protein
VVHAGFDGVSKSINEMIMCFVKQLSHMVFCEKKSTVVVVR